LRQVPEQRRTSVPMAADEVETMDATKKCNPGNPAIDQRENPTSRGHAPILDYDSEVASSACQSSGRGWDEEQVGTTLDKHCRPVSQPSFEGPRHIAAHPMADGAPDRPLVAEQCQVAEEVVAAITKRQGSSEKPAPSSVSFH
jgi:hypothetical protein